MLLNLQKIRKNPVKHFFMFFPLNSYIMINKTWILITVIISLFIFSVATAKSIAKNSSISIEELNKTPVIDLIGIPLGKVAIIETTVISGDDFKMKAYSGIFLSKVNAVNNKKFTKLPILKVYKTLSSA